MDRNRLGKIIVAMVILFWLGDWLTSQPWAPAWAGWVFDVMFVCAVLGVLIFGFRGSAWGKLAQRYPVRQPYSGGWTGCPTLHVSNVSAGDPEYDRNKVRFVGMVRLACGDDAIFLAPILSVFNVLMPPVQIPLSAITKVKTYEHSGHVQAPRDPGTLLQITYDPNFQGRIAELTVGDAPVYLQMQADLLEPVIARLPSDEEPNRAARG